MRTIRIFLSLLALSTAMLTLISGLLHAFGPRFSKSIEHNKELATTFKKAAQHVSLFKMQHGRLPSEQEFDSWAKAFPRIPYKSPYGISLISSSFPQDAIKEFGAPAKETFLLAYRRGQSMEFYAPWVNQTSLEKFEARHFVLGNKYAHVLIIVALAWAIATGGCRIWPSTKKKGDTRSVASDLFKPDDVLIHKAQQA